MNIKEEKYDVAVVIGRFQSNSLHEAHRDLIESVQAKHDKVIVFLGLSPLRNTIKNPLDLAQRRAMFNEEFPNIDVYYIEDTKSNEVWSQNLDRELARRLKPHQSVVLYGSRDSFINVYSGKYPTRELESTVYISATEIRRRIANQYPSSKDFRAGLISATYDRYPAVFTTVDMAIYDKEKDLFLMGFKTNESKPRFIGGFADPNSNSFEEDAKREIQEEVGIEVSEPRYIGSCIIDDWRYRKEIDKIKTIFYFCEYIYGRPEAADDISQVKWFSIKELVEIGTVEEHTCLLIKLIDYLNKKGVD